MIACSIMVEGYTFVGETRRVGGEFFPAAHDFHTCRAVSVTLDRDPRRSPASPVAYHVVSSFARRSARNDTRERISSFAVITPYETAVAAVKIAQIINQANIKVPY